MTFPFNPKGGPIHVEAQVTGPAKTFTLRLILDTGATTSLINSRLLLGLGYDLTQTGQFTQMTTGSTLERVPLVILTRLSALGQHRLGFPVIGHDLPASSAIDGLLGLDFFRPHQLTIDFPKGEITLT
jgi:Aspartyl protease